MKVLRMVNADRGTEIGARIQLADGWASRLRGLLGHPEPQPGEGLLLVPCRSVHMLGMRYPIDVAFLDNAGRTLSVYPDLQPGARIAGSRSARYALELRSGTLASTGTSVGDLLTWAHQERQA
jgi:uncharacterized membrane protein (UPF0127 family)